MRPRRSLAGVLFILPILLVLLTTSSSTAPSAEDEAKQKFTLAVVRRDSIAIPFATYDGKRWKNSWPAPESRVTAPIMLADVPKRWWTGRDPAMKWTFWPSDPSESSSTTTSAAGAASVDTTAGSAASAASAGTRTLETIGPTWFPAHCQQSLGLRTTYSTREVLPPLHIQPYPKAGLAVAGVANITPIEIVDIASSELVDALARTLVKSVFDEERRIIRNYLRADGNWTHPYTDEERMETPFRIEALYKVARGLGDRDVYYFEGLKHYAVREAASSSKISSKTSSKEKTPPAAQQQQQQTSRAATATSQNLQSGASAPSSPTSQLLQPSESATQSTAQPNAAKGGGPGQEPCDLVTFVSGWLIGRQDEMLKDKERITPMQVNVNVTSCDFASAYIMLPLGAVRLKDKTVWAVQWSGWTHEHYTVIEVKDDQAITLLATDGGYCPRR